MGNNLSVVWRRKGHLGGLTIFEMSPFSSHTRPVLWLVWVLDRWLLFRDTKALPFGLLFRLLCTFLSLHGTFSTLEALWLVSSVLMTSENFALLWCGLLLETQLGKQGNEGRTDIDTRTEKLGLGGAVLCPVEQHQLESSACLTMLHEEKGVTSLQGMPLKRSRLML